MRLYKGFLFIVCLYNDILSYLFFFKSINFCLYSPLLRNYVFESIGLPRCRHVLDPFTNCYKRTSIFVRILKIRICGFTIFFINKCILQVFANE